MMGTSTIAQLSASATWRQIHTPGDLAGKSMTMQGGFAESYSATVRPYTFNGCKISDWDLSCQMDGLLEANLTVDAWNWTTATALAANAYLASLEEFHWGVLGVTIGGTATTTSGRTTVATSTALKGCRAVSLKGTTGLRTDRRVAGGAGVKIEQLENNFRNYTGDLDLEFADRTQVMDLVDADTTTVLVFTWTGVTNDGSGNFPVLRVTYPAVKFESAQPEATGPDIVDGKVTFTAYEDDAGLNPLMQFEYESQDLAP
jgi:Phage tail tube protein